MKRDYKAEYRALKADSERYKLYLEGKRLVRLRRQKTRRYETTRKRQWRAANKEKARVHHRANYAVEKALKQGNLVRPEVCQGCGEAGRIEGHHHKGYAAEHWLDVLWLCQACHSAAHPKLPTPARLSKPKGDLT